MPSDEARHVTPLAALSSELNCPTATASVLSKEMIQPAITNRVWAPPQRGEYTVGVSGCNKRTTYLVVCAQGGMGCSWVTVTVGRALVLWRSDAHEMPIEVAEVVADKDMANTTNYNLSLVESEYKSLESQRSSLEKEILAAMERHDTPPEELHAVEKRAMRSTGAPPGRYSISAF